jgi:hypothetical protein
LGTHLTETLHNPRMSSTKECAVPWLTPRCNAISSVVALLLGENNGPGFLLLISGWCWWSSQALSIDYICLTSFTISIHSYALVWHCVVPILSV